MPFDPIAYINEPRWLESRLGLERIGELLERLGRPQDRLRFVHVAGTNGKGSTCAFLAGILQAAGYKTGLFTSPFIIEFADRIRVDGENIPLQDLTDVTLAVKEAAEAMEDHPTEFELMTAVAFLHFARSACDIVVAEVGMGGRLDSTNVIAAPEVCVIASIGLDHTDILGDTLGAIASEKAGIIKDEVPVVSWPQEPEAMEVVEEAAAAHRAPVTEPDFSQLQNVRYEGSLQRFDYKAYRGLAIKLLGSYQPSNAALAIEAVEVLRQHGWHIGDEALRKGLAETVWTARFEIVAEHPTFVLDGAHNVAGVRAMVESLKACFPQASPVLVMGVLKDKDYRGMIREAYPCAQMFVTVTPPNPRALSGDDLSLAIRAAGQEAGDRPHGVPTYSARDMEDAVAHARLAAGEEGLVVAFGSLYSIADLKAALG